MRLIHLVISSLLAGCLLFSSASFAHGLTLGATRLIYDANKKEATISLNNSGTTPYLVQSWVSDFNNNTQNIPFIITPPLFKLLSNDENLVRIVYVSSKGTLPTDRESVFLLNVRAIPAVEKTNDPKRLIIATQNIIKLIYRPKGLNDRDASLAGEKLNVTRAEKKLTFDNPTPYVVTLTNLTINGVSINQPGVIMPFSSKDISSPVNNVKTVNFSIINDFGGISQVREIKF